MVTPISLGADCVVAFMLERMGLREASYPFDWLFSSLPMVEHCLEDDFASFLDPSQHEPLTHKRSDHRLYRDRFGIERVFNHHGMPRELEHFERAVERFRTAPDPVFIHIVVATPPDPDCLARVRAKLRGPLLAYFIKPAAVNVEAPPGVPVLALPGKWDPGAFPVLADERGFTRRFAEDITAARQGWRPGQAA
jgi:hypothetical protein